MSQSCNSPGRIEEWGEVCPWHFLAQDGDTTWHATSLPRWQLNKNNDRYPALGKRNGANCARSTSLLRAVCHGARGMQVKKLPRDRDFRWSSRRKGMDSHTKACLSVTERSAKGFKYPWRELSYSGLLNQSRV